MKKLIALILCALLVCSCAFAEDERIELMSVGSEKVYLDDVQALAYTMYQYGLASSETDYFSGLEYYLYYSLSSALLIDDPYEYLTAEDAQPTIDEANATYDSAVASIKNSLGTTELTDEELENEVAAQVGITRQEYIDSCLKSAAFDAKLGAEDIVVTEEEVLKMYNDEAEYEMAQVSSISMYEMYTNYYGYDFLFTPEGYRGVLHILIDADAELLTAYSEAADDEAKAAAAAAVVANVQPTLDEIYAAFEAGTPFTDLIAIYNIDPGMENEENLAAGYLVHPESTAWVEEFTKGAFSEKMQAPGDISDPVVTSYGVHIEYYLRDVPAGVKEITDDYFATFYDYCRNEKILAVIEGWLKEYEISYTDAYDEYIGAPNFLDD